MKSVAQINRKINTFKTQLSKKEVYENFGNKEIHKLDAFVGFVYDYPYTERQAILTLMTDFFDWTGNYTGR